MTSQEKRDETERQLVAHHQSKATNEALLEAMRMVEVLSNELAEAGRRLGLTGLSADVEAAGQRYLRALQNYIRAKGRVPHA